MIRESVAALLPLLLFGESLVGTGLLKAASTRNHSYGSTQTRSCRAAYWYNLGAFGEEGFSEAVVTLGLESRGRII